MVRKVYLSPTLFNIFLERIKADAHKDHVVSFAGLTIANVIFADDINVIAGDEQELTDLVNAWINIFRHEDGDKCREQKVHH